MAAYLRIANKPPYSVFLTFTAFYRTLRSEHSVWDEP